MGVVFTFLAMEDSEEWVGERGGEGDEGLGDGVREVEERVHFWLPLGKRVWCRELNSSCFCLRWFGALGSFTLL